MKSLVASLSAAVLALVAAVGVAGAQAKAKPCLIEFTNTPETRQINIKLPSGGYNTFLGGGVVAVCRRDKMTIKADSAEVYADERRVFLVGHVRYDEPRFDLTSDFLTYFGADERVVAAGNVLTKMPNGSTLAGPQAEYKRVIPRVRPRAQLTALARPTVTVQQKDATGKPEPPVTIVSNAIHMDGDSLIYGSGDVQIHRTELEAFSDSMFLDSGKETMRLIRNPRLIGTGQKGQRPFNLKGELIDMFSKQRKLQRVLARSKAVATSENLVLRSDTIDLRVASDQLERAVAWGATRAHATSPTQNIVADSIDVSMPRQRVREVRAFRQALAQGRVDTARFRTDPKEKADTTDWLRGDTIVAHFDTVARTPRTPKPGAPPDTSNAPEIKRLVATGNASSFYHLAPADTSTGRFAISYSKGRVITVDFTEQKVASVNVTEQAAGMYLEPTNDTTRAAGPGRTPGRPGGAAGGPPAGTITGGAPGSTPPITAPARPAAPPPTPVRRP